MSNYERLNEYMIPAEEAIGTIITVGTIVLTGASLIKKLKLHNEVKRNAGKAAIYKDNSKILLKYKDRIVGVSDVGNIDEIINKLEKVVSIYSQMRNIILKVSKADPFNPSTEKIYNNATTKIKNLLLSIPKVPSPDTSSYKQTCQFNSSGFYKVRELINNLYTLSSINGYISDDYYTIADSLTKTMNDEEYEEFIQKIPTNVKTAMNELDDIIEKVQNFGFDANKHIFSIYRLIQVTKFVVKK